MDDVREAVDALPDGELKTELLEVLDRHTPAQTNDTGGGGGGKDPGD